jgi:Flp pilus assembly protein TadB
MRSATRAASGTRAVAPRIGSWARRSGDPRLVTRAQLLAPGAAGVRLVTAAARGRGLERGLAAARVLGVAGAALVCLLAAVAGGGPVALVAAVPACWAAAALPGHLLAGAIRRGVSAAEASLPLALELVTAALAAGIPLDRALALIAGCVDPALAAVLTRAASVAVGTGLPGRGLAEVAERAGVEELVSLAALLDRRLRLGLPLTAPLLAVAASLRARVRATALTRAARRGPLAGLVTATIVAPACALGLLTQVLAGLLTDGRLLGPG